MLYVNLSLKGEAPRLGGRKMKPEQKETLLKQSAKDRLSSTGKGKPPGEITKPTTYPPTFVPGVYVSRVDKTDGDIALTQTLLEMYSTSDGFQCPRCPYKTKDAEDFMVHLADEMNKSFKALSELPKVPNEDK